jgi:hypothetical protein
MRLNAWPLPGFTYSLSMTAYGSPSIRSFIPPRISFVVKLDMGESAASGRKKDGG